MTIRGPHSHFEVPHMESIPLDELPRGVPGDPLPARDTSKDRGPRGLFAKGNTAHWQGGVRTTKSLARALGLAELKEGDEMFPYYRLAGRWMRQVQQELAATVGGGMCGSGPSMLLATAARQWAWSMFYGDKANASAGQKGAAEMTLQASKMANDSKASYVAAQALCAQAAVARKALGQTNPARTLVDVLKEGE